MRTLGRYLIAVAASFGLGVLATIGFWGVFHEPSKFSFGLGFMLFGPALVAIFGGLLVRLDDDWFC